MTDKLESDLKEYEERFITLSWYHRIKWGLNTIRYDSGLHRYAHRVEVKAGEDTANSIIHLDLDYMHQYGAFALADINYRKHTRVVRMLIAELNPEPFRPFIKLGY